MKSAITILLTLISLNAMATILIVDQNGNAPSGAHIYTTFADAQSAANAGDTIMLIPSSSSYGNITISKDITVLGPGFNPQSTNGVTARVTDIRLNNGASGASVIGLEIPLFYLGFSASSLTNINIENNYIGYITNNSTTSLSNVLIKQNVFYTTANASNINLNVTTQNNIVVANNIFSRNNNSTHASIDVTTGGVLIEHNLFYGSGASNSYAFYRLNNSEVRNNIFYGRLPRASGSVNDSQFFNNLSFGATTNDLSDDNGSGVGSMTFGTNTTGDNNLASQDPGFVGTIPFENNAWDYSYDATLSGTPDLSTASKDGTSELGVYGGSSPFKNTGSVVPIVSTFDVPTTVQEGTNTTADIVVTGN